MYNLYHILGRHAILMLCLNLMLGPTSGLIRAQNDDGPFKWANGPYPIQKHANFQILMGHLKFLRALC